MKYDCARVDWVDSNGFGTWHVRDEEKNIPSACVSVGMIEMESEEAITLRLSIDTLLNRVDNTITIPKCAVKSIKRFKI
jgi:hypothetical protein